MPFDPGQYVYKPRPLQQFDFGQGFRDIIDARNSRRQLEEQQASRNDLNTRFAAQLGSDQSKDAYSTALKQYNSLISLADAARQASAAGDENMVESMAPTIIDLGGSVNRTPSPTVPGKFVYEILTPPMPKMESVNYGQVRNQIFDSAPRPPGLSGAGGPPQQPQQAAPPGPQPPGQGPPTDRLPGISQAALPPAMPSMQLEEPTIGAPQGGGFIQPPQIPIPGGEPQAAGTGSINLNSGNENLFDPFKLDMGLMMNRNRARLEPLLQGIQKGYPGYESNFNELNAGILDYGGTPEEALKLGQPGLNQVGRHIDTLIRAAAQSASLGQRGAGMQFSQEQELRRYAATRIDKLSTEFDLKKNADRWRLVGQARDSLDANDRGNGNAAVNVVQAVHDMNIDGVLTDNDFKNESQGMKTVWQSIIDGTASTLYQNGFPPAVAANFREILAIAERNMQKRFRDAETNMLGRVENDPNIPAIEKSELIRLTGDAIPQEFWGPRLRNYYQLPLKNVTPVGAGGGGGANASASQSGNPNLTPAQLRQRVRDMLDKKE